MKLTDERIEEIKAAEKAATPGSWENIPAWNVVEKVDDDVPLMDCLHKKDAQLVVILRNTIPELLADREERGREIERLNGDLGIALLSIELLKTEDRGKGFVENVNAILDKKASE